MPVQHRTKFEKCANNKADRAIRPDCSQVPKDFKPHSRSAVVKSAELSTTPFVYLRCPGLNTSNIESQGLITRASLAINRN